MREPGTSASRDYSEEPAQERSISLCPEKRHPATMAVRSNAPTSPAADPGAATPVSSQTASYPCISMEKKPSLQQYIISTSACHFFLVTCNAKELQGEKRAESEGSRSQ